jgi:8-oxo-dGTP pyrophosphatase MutT (NUDIX family)
MQFLRMTATAMSGTVAATLIRFPTSPIARAPQSSRLLGIDRLRRALPKIRSTSRDFYSGSGFKMQQMSERSVEDIVPRAAVSTCVEMQLRFTPSRLSPTAYRSFYLMVQRGKSPNKGMWSFPGGKIVYKESVMKGAYRELSEEVTLLDADRSPISWDSVLQWYPSTVGTSDSIGPDYHYVISQCYSRFVVDAFISQGEEKLRLVSNAANLATRQLNLDTFTLMEYPQRHDIESIVDTVNNLLVATDDAADARFFTLPQIEEKEFKECKVTPGVSHIIHQTRKLTF